MSTASKSLMVAGACALACLAVLVQAQYNNFDSDSNSELGKLVRNSGRIQAQNQRLNQQAAAAVAAATRNLHNHQQPLQYAPSHQRGNNAGAMRDHAQAYGGSLSSAMNQGAMSPQGRSGSSANSEMDDDEGSSYGPSFDGPTSFGGQANLHGASNANNNDDGEGSGLDGPSSGSSGLDKAASGGYPSSQGDYNNDGAGFNFDGANFGPSSGEGADFGPSEAQFGGHEGKRAKSASAPMSSRNYGGDDSDAGAPQYGPNSAINADGDEVVDGRAGYAPQGDANEDNDDE